MLGAVSGARLQVLGAVSGARPQVLGAVSGARPQVLGAVSGARPQVAGAVSGAMLQVLGAVSGATPQVPGASLGAELQVSGAHQDQVSRPDGKVNPGEGTGSVLSPESQGFSSLPSRENPNKQGTDGGRASPQDWLGPDPVQEWKYDSVINLLGIAQVSKTFGVLVGADVKLWKALSLTSIVVLFRATGIVHRNVLPGMHSTKPKEASYLSAGPERCPSKGQGCSVNQVLLNTCVQGGTQAKGPQLHVGHLQHSSLSGLKASEETRSCRAFPLLTAPQLRGVSNAEAETLVKSRVQQALHQMGFAVTQVSQVTELLIQESFADIIAVVVSQENLVEFAAKVGQLPCRGMNEGQRLPEPIGIGEQSPGPIGSSEVKIEKELGRFDHSGKDNVGEHQRPLSATPSCPCDHLTWYILLKKGTLSEFVGTCGLNLLLACSEGLHTLGWGLGCPSQVAGCSQPVLRSDLKTKPLQALKKALRPTSQTPIVTSSTENICPHFLKGFCRYGERCKFVHQGRSDPSVPSQAAATLGPKGVLRKHYLKGFCNRGQYCKFSHEAGTAHPEAENVPQETGPATVATPPVCPHYARGYCKRGENCNYSHQASSLDLDAASANSDAFRNQKRQQMSQVPAQSAMSVVEQEQDTKGPEPVTSGYQKSGWQPNRCEAASLKDAIAQEGQAVQTAGRKFTAPRPEQHFQKGVKTQKLGSSILKGIRGSKQRIGYEESVDRPKTRQPCVFAPAPYRRPVGPKTNGRKSRPFQAGEPSERCTQLTGVMRRTQNHNAPGTKMKACKPEAMPKSVSLDVRLPWADLVDTDSDEESVCSQDAPSDGQDGEVEGNYVTLALGNHKRIGRRTGCGKPHGISYKRWRRHVRSTLKVKGCSHRPQDAVLSPCSLRIQLRGPEENHSEVNEGMSQGPKGITVRPSSCASGSSNLDTSVR